MKYSGKAVAARKEEEEEKRKKTLKATCHNMEKSSGEITTECECILYGVVVMASKHYNNKSSSDLHTKKTMVVRCGVVWCGSVYNVCLSWFRKCFVLVVG